MRRPELNFALGKNPNEFKAASNSSRPVQAFIDQYLSGGAQRKLDARTPFQTFTKEKPPGCLAAAEGYSLTSEIGVNHANLHEIGHRLQAAFRPPTAGRRLAQMGGLIA